jgi:bla regulator protein blaR1
MINHLWQSTVFAIAAGLLTVAFRKNRAAVRYWLWFSASVKFLVPFTLLTMLGGRVEKHVTRPVLPVVVAPLTQELLQVSAPFADVPFVPPQQNRDWTGAALFGAWLCGFLGVALMRLRGWRRIRAAVRSSTPLEIGELASLEAERAVKVDVRSSPGLLEPGIIGIRRPVLLLPASIADRLSPAQFQAVLAHELCHTRRRDNLTSAIHMIVEAIFWFHPLVWWIGARLVEERERACDEEVLRRGGEPRDYAEAIVSICKLYAESPLACVSGVTGANLKKRIEAIMLNRISPNLTLARKAALVTAGIVAVALPIGVGMMSTPAIRAQTSAGKPQYEVASIRRCEGPAGRGAPKSANGNPPVSPGRLNMCATPWIFINVAYLAFADGHRNPQPYPKIEGDPAWIRSEFFQINSKAEDEHASPEMVQGPMLQALLEDRFKLKVHRETREAPVYALTVAKGGPKLKPSKDGTCTPRDPSNPPQDPTSTCGTPIFGSKGPNMTWDVRRWSIGEFFTFIGGLLDRPVINKTGIMGNFDFHLEFVPDDATPGVFLPALSLDPTGGTSIFTAVQEQLGLKLESAKGPREYLVIDHVERPSEN